MFLLFTKPQKYLATEQPPRLMIKNKKRKLLKHFCVCFFFTRALNKSYRSAQDAQCYSEHSTRSGWKMYIHITAHVKSLSFTLPVSKQQTQRTSLPIPCAWGTLGRGSLSWRRRAEHAGLILGPPASLCHVLSPNPRASSKPSMFLKTQLSSFPPWGDRKYQVWNILVCPPPFNTDLLTVNFYSGLSPQGSPPSPTMWLLDAISSHTPRAPGSLTEGGWPSQFPFWAIKKELFSQPRSAHLKRGFRTKGEWEYREEGQKNPERNTCDATLVPLYQNAVTRIQNT